jgi:hypothetical protein
MKVNGDIPKELYDAEQKLRQTLDATDAFVQENSAVFEQFEELVNTRNERIEECKKLCKRHQASTDLFKTNVAKKTVYDPESFRKVFGPSKLVKVCEIPTKRVKAMVESGLILETDLEKVDAEVKETVRVTGVPKKWEIS